MDQKKRKPTDLNPSKDRYNLSGDTNEAIHPFVPRSQDGGLAESRLAENRSPVNKKTMEVLQDLIDTVGVEIPESDKALFSYSGQTMTRLALTLAGLICVTLVTAKA